MPRQQRAYKRPIKPCGRGAHGSATEHSGVCRDQEVIAADGAAGALDRCTDRTVNRGDRLLQPGYVDRRQDCLRLRGEPRRASARGTVAQRGGNDDAGAHRRFADRGDPAGDCAARMLTAPMSFRLAPECV